ncbi:MAG: hypothetical protein ABR611_06635 [Chthoniobacterales bacterium]
MLRLRFACSFLAGAVIAPVTLAAPIEQSISTSRQFIVYGTDVEVRGAICDFAERTKRELLTLVDERDDWKTAIVINPQYPQANLPELPQLRVDVGQTGFGLKLQLDLVVSSQVTRPEIRREMLRALLLEMMYRGQPNLPAGAAYISPPDWLLEGIPSAESDLSRDRVAGVLALPATANTVLPLEKFLMQRPELLDAAGRTLYRAYAFALVDLLSGAPDGPRRLARFVADLPVASNDPMSELRKHFPNLFASEMAEKNWAKQIARLSAGQPYQLLGSAETGRLLTEKLRLEISERGLEKSYELEQFPIFLKFGSAKSVLGALAHDLSALATRANPVYAPIVAEYADIAARLLRGKTGGLRRRLERLRSARDNVTAQMHQIDDYMNWFEATNLAGPSGEFTDYMRAAKRAGQPERTKRDPISVYLDVLETQFEN